MVVGTLEGTADGTVAVFIAVGAVRALATVRITMAGAATAPPAAFGRGTGTRRSGRGGAGAGGWGGPRFGYRPYYYGGYSYGAYGCYRPVTVYTPYGPRVRRVWVCG